MENDVCARSSGGISLRHIWSFCAHPHKASDYVHCADSMSVHYSFNADFNAIFFRRWIYEPDGFLRIKPDDELIRSTDVWQIEEVLKKEVSAVRSSAR